MKFSLKTLAAAAVMAVAASGANAAIDNGSLGNGELFFNIWDANGSYSRDLNISINTFESDVTAAGTYSNAFAADTAFTNYLSSVANPSALQWNIIAIDTKGAQRLLTTFTAPTASPVKDTVTRSVTTADTTFANAVNTALVAAKADSVAVGAASAAWAGATFGASPNTLLFSSAGTLANNSFATGLGFLRVNAAASGTGMSTYNPYSDAGSKVNVWISADNTIHMEALAAAVPEPESYAMLLAGLGMIGLMAGRRNKRA